MPHPTWPIPESAGNSCPMNVLPTELPGVLIIEPRLFSDERGLFFEAWNQEQFARHGLATEMRQDNVSWSRQGVIRGLHYQHPHSQAKLVYVLEGEVFDVAVDVRVGSPTFGRWKGTTLSAENRRQLYMPAGFAHGFCVVSDGALVAYKCSDVYRAECDAAVAWNDPELGIRWPLMGEPIVSAKDRTAPRLADVPRERLPVWQPSGDR